MSKKTEASTTASLIHPGDLYTFGLLSIAKARGISLDDAATQTVEELRLGHSDEHIEPTLQALAWLKANPPKPIE